MGCIGCGVCCTKHWLLRLINDYEKSLFEGHIVFGEYTWTDECPYLKNNKCELHNGDKPQRCKDYTCEKH